MSGSKPHANAEPIAGYRLRRYLGRGGFGEVWEAEAPGGLAKAVKIAPVETVGDQFTCRELEGLTKIRAVRHPYLLSIERFEVVDGFLIIVMELADKSLADRFAECASVGEAGIAREELLRYLTEAAEVLDLLSERHGLQHLDIKPENLFLSGDHVKVADFGLVQPRNTHINRSAIAISPPYAPPELFDGRIETTADQYSLAITYQELLTGTRPYQGVDVRGLMLQHLKGRPDLSMLPPGDRAIVSRAIHRDPAARFPNCTELVQALVKAPRSGALGTAERIASLTPTPSRPPVSSQLRAQPLPPARTHHVRARVVRDTEKSATRTVAIGPDGMPIGSSDLAPTGDSVQASFVAFLPTEIYAHKLRGFIDAMEAEVLSCTTLQTILYIGQRGWFGKPSGRGFFMVIDTVTRQPHSGFRVCEARIWSAGRSLTTPEMGRRGMLLVRCLKFYLMATDNAEPTQLHGDAEIRAALLA